MDEHQDAERVDRILTEYDRDRELYERFCASIEQLLKGLMGSPAFRIHAVTSRVKKRASLARKVRENDKYGPLTNITDVAGARVITYFEDDVDRVAAVIRDPDNFEIDVHNSDDKRLALRSDQFGYQSLHLVAGLAPDRISHRENADFAGFKIEIQIRSILQQAWAEIEHGLGYKSATRTPVAIRRRFSRLAGLLELADDEFVAVREQVSRSSGELPICRAEGITELVPDFSIDFSHKVLPALSELSNKSLALWINTNVTNKYIAGYGNEVKMYVEDGRTRVDRASATQVGANQLVFSDVFPIYPIKGTRIRIRFSGLRVNACQLGATATLAPTTVAAALGLYETGKAPILISEGVDVARVVGSLAIDVVAVGRPSDKLPIRFETSERPAEVALRVTYRALTPHAFRPPEDERAPGEMGEVNGTRLAFCLTGAPAGAGVFVTLSDISEENNVSFEVRERSRQDQHGRMSIRRSIDGLSVDVAEINTMGGIVAAVWECVRSTRSASFAVFITLPPDADISNVAVFGSFSPVSTVQTSSLSSPIPRFCSLGPSPVKLFEDGVDRMPDAPKDQVIQ